MTEGKFENHFPASDRGGTLIMLRSHCSILWFQLKAFFPLPKDCFPCVIHESFPCKYQFPNLDWERIVLFGALHYFFSTNANVTKCIQGVVVWYEKLRCLLSNLDLTAKSGTADYGNLQTGQSATFCITVETTQSVENTTIHFIDFIYAY